MPGDNCGMVRLTCTATTQDEEYEKETGEGGRENRGNQESHNAQHLLLLVNLQENSSREVRKFDNELWNG